MRILVAGETKEVKEGLTVAELLVNEQVETPEYVTVTVNDDGTIDPLVIDGTLTLGENAKLVINGARYLPRNAASAITAAGGITGNFASVETDNGNVAKVKYADGVVMVAKRGGFCLIVR